MTTILPAVALFNSSTGTDAIGLANDPTEGQSQTVNASGSADYFSVSDADTLNSDALTVNLGQGTQWVGNIDQYFDSSLIVNGSPGSSMWNYGNSIIGGQVSTVINTSINGQGTFTLERIKPAGSYLELGGPVASGETFILGAGNTSILKLDNAPSFLGTVDIAAGGTAPDDSAEIRLSGLAAAAQAYVYEGNELYIIGVVNGAWARLDQISLVASAPFSVTTSWHGMGVDISTANAPFKPPGTPLADWTLHS